MTVYDLIEVLEKLDGKTEVLLHETLDLGEDGKFLELSKLKSVRSGFAMNMEIEYSDSGITVYDATGHHHQGYLIDTPVVVLSTEPPEIMTLPNDAGWSRTA